MIHRINAPLPFLWIITWLFTHSPCFLSTVKTPLISTLIIATPIISILRYPELTDSEQFHSDCSNILENDELQEIYHASGLKNTKSLEFTPVLSLKGLTIISLKSRRWRTFSVMSLHMQNFRIVGVDLPGSNDNAEIVISLYSGLPCCHHGDPLRAVMLTRGSWWEKEAFVSGNSRSHVHEDEWCSSILSHRPPWALTSPLYSYSTPVSRFRVLSRVRLSNNKYWGKWISRKQGEIRGRALSISKPLHRYEWIPTLGVLIIVKA